MPTNIQQMQTWLDSLKLTVDGLAAERDEGRVMVARVGHAADRLLDCLNEFAPEYPQACAQYAEHLDAVLAEAEAGDWFKRRGSP